MVFDGYQDFLLVITEAKVLNKSFQINKYLLLHSSACVVKPFCWINFA